MVSIKDVARVAGVSDKTVSRVVNGEPNVHPDTQERVERAIADLKYVPNLSARLVRTNQSRTIGVMTDFVSTTPYSGNIVRGIQDWAKAAGRTVLIINTGGDPDEERRAWRTFQEHRSDGVIFATMAHRDVAIRGRDLPVATVLVNCVSTADTNLPAMVPNDYAGSKELIELLCKQGHRRIGYVRLNPALKAAHLRITAFRDTLNEHNIVPDETLIVDGMYGEVGQDINVAFESTLELLRRPDPPTAIVAGNDEIALPVYCAAMSMGLRIPHDVSIVGFDDFQTVARGLRPQLTTAALPYYRLGMEGARMLEAILVDSSAYAGVHYMDCPIIERQSVASPGPDF
ncbi:MAG: LacI family DNA-binding transcriptional regulator [Fimbriimonadaceae bacterium]|nr:LacI family DNA-binding transcriptional regulator [Fimbriimonadaceae bacterium]